MRFPRFHPEFDKVIEKMIEAGFHVEEVYGGTRYYPGGVLSDKDKNRVSIIFRHDCVDDGIYGEFSIRQIGFPLNGRKILKESGFINISDEDISDEMLEMPQWII